MRGEEVYIYIYIYIIDNLMVVRPYWVVPILKAGKLHVHSWMRLIEEWGVRRRRKGSHLTKDMVGQDSLFWGGKYNMMPLEYGVESHWTGDEPVWGISDNQKTMTTKGDC